MVGVNGYSSSPHSSQLTSKRSIQDKFLQNIFSFSPSICSESHPEINLPDRPSSLIWVSEKVVGRNSENTTPNSKSSAELRNEIATLEIEITRMEQYLLTLYRTTFEEHLPSLPNINKTRLNYKTGSPLPIVLDKPPSSKFKLHDANLSSPAYSKAASDSQDSSSSLKSTSTQEQQRRCNSGRRSLADHLSVRDIRSPDKLSEEIVRCISSIYCKLSNVSQNNASISASPPSSLSSSSIFSSKNHFDSWSPRYSEDTSVNLREDSGPHGSVIEVMKIWLDEDGFEYAAKMLQNFRLLVRNLEKVDPRKMKREEKLAFWINIHNALLMHAYLAYGTNNRVRSTSTLKAAYNVGGHCINGYIIQSSILGIRPHTSAPWLQTLFSPGRKFKTGTIKHVYSLEYPEPLVHFALCSGAYSDPTVRVYTAKSIFNDLRLAKEDFIQTNVQIHKNTKIMLPKIMYYYAKDVSLDMPRLLEEVAKCFSDVQKKALRKCMKGRHEKCIHWLSQSSSFRYVIDRELGKGRTNI